jgi:hypothetical protein
VRYGNAVETMRRNNGSEKLVAQATASIFQIPSIASRFDGHIGAVGHKIKTKFSSQPGDERFVFVGIGAAKLMVKMQNKKVDSQSCTQLHEQPQKRHGIRAARNGHADAVSRTNHRMPLDGI